MSLYVVDIGNTNTRLHELPAGGGLVDFTSADSWPDGVPEPSRDILRFPSQDWLTRPDECRQKLGLVPAESGNSWALVSVVPAATSTFRAEFPASFLVGSPEDLPFSHNIIGPETVGPDRCCNVAAAVGSGLHSALVVDAGTATTIDLLLEGRFEGGLIAPGMALAASSLAAHGALLPETDFGPSTEDVGRDTRQALERGCWLAGVGGVEWSLARLQVRYGDLPVILTGGLGGHLKKPGRHHDPLWTVRGAAWLASQ